MKLFRYELEGFAKALVILVAFLLVASGLCGLQWAASMGGSRLDAVFLPLGIVELIAILLSAVGIVLVLIAWGIRAIFGGSAD
jgi:hypothetical protein